MIWKEEWFGRAYCLADSLRSEKLSLPESRFIIEKMGLPERSRILDVGCGYGNHLIHLREMGMDVYGLDISSHLLRILRKRDAFFRSGEAVVLGDMRRLPFGPKFDAAINLYSALGTISYESSDIEFIREVQRILRAGGKLVIDVDNRSFYDSLEKKEGEQTFTLGDARFRGYWKYDPASSILETTDAVVMGSRSDISLLRQKLYSLDELSGLLVNGGFSVVEVYGSLTGETYSPGSSRIVIIALKKSFPPKEQPVTDMVLFATNRCNLRCAYCYASHGNAHSLNRETGEQAVRWFIEQGRKSKKPLMIAFYGGEPLLEFGLVKHLICYASSIAESLGVKIRFGITTNGTLLSKEMLEFFRWENVHLIVSIDGDREAHDMFRRTAAGAGSFDMIERIIPELLRERPDTFVRMTVNPRTVGKLSSNVEYLLCKGFKNLAIGPNIESVWQRDDWYTFEGECRRVAEIYLKRISAGCSLSIAFINDSIKHLRRGMRPPAPCGAGKTLVGVSVEGKIYPCHRFVASFGYSGSYELGNVWAGIDEEKRLPFRRYTSQHSLGCSSPCERCPAVSICGGGCLSKAHEYNGNFLLPLRSEQYVYSIWAVIVKEVMEHLEKQNPELLDELFPKKWDGSMTSSIECSEPS